MGVGAYWVGFIELSFGLGQRRIVGGCGVEMI